MRIIISDSSCLIDLRKASLLSNFFKLPYEILIPDTLFEDELLRFTSTQRRILTEGGLKVVDLPAAQVLRAREIVHQVPQLSIHDGFAFALAEANPGCILLTGDKQLRILADGKGIDVHGFLWVVDELYRCEVSAADVLCGALRLLADDPAVRLPRRELALSIKRYGALQ
jgi:hypothetical protein